MKGLLIHNNTKYILNWHPSLPTQIKPYGTTSTSVTTEARSQLDRVPRILEGRG